MTLEAIAQQLAVTTARLDTLALRVNDVPAFHPFGDFVLRALEGIPGMEVALLPAYDSRAVGHVQVRGVQGAQAPRGTVSVPQGVRLHITAGAVLWWQDSAGEEPRRYDAGEVIDLGPGEKHGFVILEDYLSYNTFYAPA